MTEAAQALPPALAEAIAVMDRLRSPGGCPWDAEQTHASLAPYAVEEAYEVAEAAESGDAVALREELGDLLLQVLFHARVASERPDGFDLDDVARGLVDKLVRRHPHVFADVDAADATAVEANWHEIKKAERAAAGKEPDPFAGIPLALPALARAQKLLSRAEKSGLALPAPERGDEQARIGADLLAVVARARAAGVDAEAALRAVVRDTESHLRT